MEGQNNSLSKTSEVVHYSKIKKGDNMKKFILLHIGFVPPTEKIMQEWGSWFQEVGDKFIDAGSHFMFGREIAKDGSVKELPLGLDSYTGYSIIKAENMEEAEQIASSCPSITAIRIYDAGSI